MTRLTSALAGLALALAFGGAGQAAPLGVAAAEPSLTIFDIEVEFLDLVPFGDISILPKSVDAASGVTPAGTAFADFIISYLIADPADAAEVTGGFFLEDDDGVLLSGDASAIGFADGVIEVLFGNIGGSTAAAFGEQVLGVISFQSLMGNPFDSFADGDLYLADASFSSVVPPAAVIPLPAALPLLGGGLVMLGLVRRRRRTA